MRKYLYLILIPLLLTASCVQRTTTTTRTTTDPNTGQQVTTQTTSTGYDDGTYAGVNQNYQVVNNGGQDYAVCYVNGAQQYIPYSYFQQCMALGGYAYLSTYYGLHPGYFHPYSYHWSNSSRYAGGSYGSYYRANHINAAVYAPKNRVAVQGTNPQNGQRGTGTQINPGAGGMRNAAPAAQVSANTGTSGMRNQPQQQQRQQQPQYQQRQSNSGMRSGSSGSSGSSRSSSSSSSRSSSGRR